VILLSFGDPAPFCQTILQTPSKLVINVHTIEQAKQAEQLGAHALIAQGNEAGGHIYKNKDYH
jgi:nitronate monooxygenase